MSDFLTGFANSPLKLSFDKMFSTHCKKLQKGLKCFFWEKGNLHRQEWVCYKIYYQGFKAHIKGEKLGSFHGQKYIFHQKLPVQEPYLVKNCWFSKVFYILQK